MQTGGERMVDWFPTFSSCKGSGVQVFLFRGIGETRLTTAYRPSVVESTRRRRKRRRT
jgi:hypothetical protein